MVGACGFGEKALWGAALTGQGRHPWAGDAHLGDGRVAQLPVFASPLQPVGPAQLVQRGRRRCGEGYLSSSWGGEAAARLLLSPARDSQQEWDRPAPPRGEDVPG